MTDWRNLVYPLAVSFGGWVIAGVGGAIAGLAIRRRARLATSAKVTRLRDHRLIFICAAALAAAYAIGLAVAYGHSFQQDEWSFIIDRRITLPELLRPHNEHLAALHVLVYRTLVETFGIGSYLPFLAVLVAIHVATAAGVWRLLLTALPPAGALAGATLFLFLGSGFDNILWPFQIGFSGAISLGVWSLVAVRRPWLSAVLLTLAILAQSDALFFVLPLAVLLPRRAWAWLLLPLGVYGAWFLIVGRSKVPLPPPGPYIAYFIAGLAGAVGGIVGLGAKNGMPVLGVLAAYLAARVRSGYRPTRIVWAGLAGLVSTYGILALARSQFGPEQAIASRYIYAAAPFLLMLLPAVGELPRRAWQVAFGVAMAGNVLALNYGAWVYQVGLAQDQAIPLEQRIAPFRTGTWWGATID